MYRLTSWLAAALMLFSIQATAASLSDIQVSNGDRQARITISFIGEPEYSFSPQGKRIVALDIKQTGVLQGLPLQFSGNNLVKSIRSGTPQDTQSLRLLVDLTADGKTRAVKQQNGSNYTVVFTINADAPPPPPPQPVVVRQAERPVAQPVRPSEPARIFIPRTSLSKRRMRRRFSSRNGSRKLNLIWIPRPASWLTKCMKWYCA